MTDEEMNVFTCRITQASRTELIVVMYDMVIRYLEEAVVSIQENKNDISNYRQRIKSAQRVINQLSSSLDMNYDISYELMNLYAYFSRTLVTVSVNPDMELVKAITGMIQKLRASFYELSLQDQTGPLMQNVQEIYAGLTYSNGRLDEYQDNTKRGFTV